MFEIGDIVKRIVDGDPYSIYNTLSGQHLLIVDKPSDPIAYFVMMALESGKTYEVIIDNRKSWKKIS